MSSRTEIILIVLLGLLISVLFAVAMLTLTGGHPMAPLDDTFIFLQYAKMLSRGYFFEYTPGAGYSTGSSSQLYPFLLTPFFWFGLDGVKMVGITFLYGVFFLIISALLLRSLANQWFPWKHSGFMSALFFLFNGNLCWGYLSGMDVGLFATLILLTLWYAQRWFGENSKNNRKNFSLFLLFLALMSIARPEGIVLVTVAFLFFGILFFKGLVSFRNWITIAVVGFILPVFFLFVTWVFTGSISTNGLQAKSILHHPYFNFWDIARLISENFISIWSGYYANIMPAEMYSQFKHTLIFPYFPPLSLCLFFPGVLFVVKTATKNNRQNISILMLLFFFAGICSLVFLETLHAHSQRYFHPYQSMYLLLMTAGIFFLGEILYHEKSIFIGKILALILLLMSTPSLLYWAREYGENCNDLYNQHRRMSWWVKDATPKDAVLGLTDCGLIPYYTDRRTLDFVGLVTNDMARWWRSGIGSTFEKIEHLTAEWLPDYIITHPALWGEKNFLGKPVYQITLLDNTVSLGPVMVAYKQDWGLLNSGRFPALEHNFSLNTQKMRAKIVDELDVADLDSESEHHYIFRNDPERRLFRHWPYRQNLYQQTPYSEIPRIIADGGREITGLEEFIFRAIPHQPAKIVMRTDAISTVTLSVEINKKFIGNWIIAQQGVESANSPPQESVFWREPEFFIPASVVRSGKLLVRLRCHWSHIGTGDIHRSFHYWLLQPFESRTSFIEENR